jgi:hypothetical protein
MCGWEDDTRMAVKEIRFEGVNWIYKVQIGSRDKFLWAQ